MAAEVRDSGTGAWLVLLHGGGFTLRSWDRTIDALSQSWRVCAIDLPGHGLSDDLGADGSYWAAGRQVSAALDSAGISHPVVVGWSLGWPIAMCTEAVRDDVRGLVSVDGAVATWSDEVAPFSSMDEFLSDIKARSADTTAHSTDFEAVIASDPLLAWTTEAEVKRMWHREGTYVKRPRSEDGVRRTLDNWEFNTPEVWAALRCPVLYVLATQHPEAVVLTHRSAGAQRAQDHARTTVVELDAPHAVPLAKPTELAAVIERFAQSLE